MIGRLNHIAIAVPDLGLAVSQYETLMGASSSEVQELPSHGVRVVFIDLPNTRIELLEPMGECSPIENFLSKSPVGGIHHICYEVSDIEKAKEKLLAEGARILGGGKTKIGAHGNPVLFLHPNDFNGCLIELEQVS